MKENTMKLGLALRVYGAAVAAIIGLHATAAQSAEIRMLNSAAIKPVMETLGPQFEKTAGHKIVIRYELTPAVKALADKGEPFDVVIASPPHIDDLIKQGKVAAGSRADIARFGVGLGVRQGASKPDITSVDAFKRAMLDAKSVAYVAAGTSGAFVTKMLDSLGISDDMKPKLKPGGPDANLAAVAKGDVQVVLMPAPLILAHSGVELAGELPLQLQDHIVMTAGVSSAAIDPAAAQALVKFLMGSENTATISAKGYERMKP
jgi:molybdate transport system substrate-binding protein